MTRLLALLLLLLAPASAAAEEGSPADPYAAARRYCAQQGISRYSYHERYIGNGKGLLAPIIKISGGGLLVVGTRSDNKPGTYRVGKSRPVVVKLDPAGHKVWERAFKKAGFLDHEGASAIEVEGGFIVYILSYVHPSRGSVTRLLKLDVDGKILWERQLRGNGGDHTPFPQTIELTSKGTLVLKGHIYLDRSETAYGWDGEVDGKGKVLVDRVGGPNPYK